MPAPRDDSGTILWIIAVAGLVIGAIVSVPGLLLLDLQGPAVLIVGLIILAFGAGALFTYLGKRRQPF